MYDELIARIRYHIRKADFMGLKEYESTRLLNEAADAIEELQQITTHYEEESKGWWLAACDAKEERERLKEQIPKWIPVTVRLPEAKEVVLICGKRGGIYTAEHNRNALRPGSFWKLNSKNHHCEPTHWMPIPQPPKDGET